mmetsp:Transcript_51711/g.123088  ORF Transcript_51711/g.123088 Transcript_51711/m.123088 type:complete len:170 (+) Transcript_51711:144-653(+)
MGKRWRPPPTEPPKARMDCTLQEHLAKIKDQEKAGSASLAAWEKEHSVPDDPAEMRGPVQTASMMNEPAGPQAPKGGKKEKAKEKKKAKKEEKKKKKKDAKKKKKEKKKKGKKSSSSDSSSGSGSSDSSSNSSDADEQKKKKRKFEKAAKTSKQGWRISDFLKAGDSDD